MTFIEARDAKDAAHEAACEEILKMRRAAGITSPAWNSAAAADFDRMRATARSIRNDVMNRHAHKIAMAQDAYIKAIRAANRGDIA